MRDAGGNTWVSRLGIAVLAVATNGCSFLMLHGAPSDPGQRTTEAARECTSGIAAPLADTGFALLGGMNLALSAASDNGGVVYGFPVKKKQVGVAIGVAQLVVFGTSAAYGFVQTTRCRKLEEQEELQRELVARPKSTPGQPAPRPAVSGAPAATVGADSAAATNGDATVPVASAPKPPAPAPASTELPAWSAFRRLPLGETPAPVRQVPRGAEVVP